MNARAASLPLVSLVALGACAGESTTMTGPLSRGLFDAKGRA